MDEDVDPPATDYNMRRQNESRLNTSLLDNILTLENASVTAKLEALQNINQLCKQASDKILEFFATHDALPLVLSQLRASNSELNHVTLITLNTICKTPLTREAIIKSGGLQLLTLHLRSTNNEVVLEAAQCLGKLAKDEAHASTIVEGDVLPVLVTLLKSPSEEIVITVANSLNLLLHGLYGSGNEGALDGKIDEMTAEGVMPPLISRLYSDNPDVVRAASGVLLYMLFHEQNCNFYLDRGALPRLLQLLNSDMDQQVVYAAASVANLACFSRCAELIVEHGGLLRFLMLLRSDNDKIIQRALRGIYNVTVINKYCGLVAQLGLSYIIQALETKKSPILEFATGILNSCSKYERCPGYFVFELVKAGAVPTLFSLQSMMHETISSRATDILERLEKAVRQIACCLDMRDENLRVNAALTLPYLTKKSSKAEKYFVFIEKKGIQYLMDLLKEPDHFVKALKSVHCLMVDMSPMSNLSNQVIPHINDEYKSWFNKPEVSDVKFIVEGKSIYASKFILVARSEYFKKLFLTGMRESRDHEIPVQDIEYEIFYKLMEFLHTNGIKIQSRDEAVNLLMAADRYQLEKIKRHAEDYLSKAITKETVLKIFQLASAYNSDGLKKYCLDWLLSNCEKLLEDSDSGIEILQMVLQGEDGLKELTQCLTQAFSYQQPSNEGSSSASTWRDGAMFTS